MKNKADKQAARLSKKANVATNMTEEFDEKGLPIYHAKNVDTSSHVREWLSLDVLIGKAVLPAQILPKKGGKLSAALAEEFKENDYGLQLQRLIVKLNDGTALDTLEVSHQNNAINKGYIVHFPGNYEDYDNLDVKRVLMQKEFNSVFFNYRNVGLSKGDAYNSQDLINDGIAQVQRLLDKGVAPDLIFLHGYSLGGGISVNVYEHFQKKGILLGYIFNNRSFNSLQNAASDFIGGFLNLPDNSVVANAIKSGLQYYHWDIESQQPFSAIPADRKGGAYAEWLHKKNPTPGDGMISEVARLKDDSLIKYYNWNPTIETHVVDDIFLRSNPYVKDEIGDLGKSPLENFLIACQQRVKQNALAMNESNSADSKLDDDFENIQDIIQTAKKNIIQATEILNTTPQLLRKFTVMEISIHIAKARKVFNEAQEIYDQYGHYSEFDSSFDSKFHDCLVELQDQEKRVVSLLQNEAYALIVLPQSGQDRLCQIAKNNAFGNEANAAGEAIQLELNQLNIFADNYLSAVMANDFNSMATIHEKITHSLNILLTSLAFNAANPTEAGLKSALISKIKYNSQISLLEFFLSHLPGDPALHKSILQARQTLLAMAEKSSYKEKEKEILTLLQTTYQQLLRNYEGYPNVDEILVGKLENQIDIINMTIDNKFKSSEINKENVPILSISPRDTIGSPPTEVTSQRKSSILERAKHGKFKSSSLQTIDDESTHQPK